MISQPLIQNNDNINILLSFQQALVSIQKFNVNNVDILFFISYALLFCYILVKTHLFLVFLDVPLKLLPLEFTKCLSSPLSRMRETNSICKRHKRSSQVALGFLKSSQIVNVHTAPQAFETSLKDLDLKSKKCPKDQFCPLYTDSFTNMQEICENETNLAAA